MLRIRPPDSCALDFSHVCKSPASYTPKALGEYEGDEGSLTVTCDEIMARSVYFGGGLGEKDFSSPFECASESDEVKNIVNTIAAQCCGSGSAESQRSACHVDYSHICKTPSSATPNVEYDEGQTCDELMGYAAQTF